jgi:hypothetical protein
MGFVITVASAHGQGGKSGPYLGGALCLSLGHDGLGFGIRWFQKRLKFTEESLPGEGQKAFGLNAKDQVLVQIEHWRMKGHKLKQRALTDAMGRPGFAVAIERRGYIMTGFRSFHVVDRLDAMLQDREDHVTARNRHQHDIHGQDQKSRTHE